MNIQLSFFLILFPLTTCQYDLQDYGALFSPKHISKYLWGTYKPNLYFAMRQRKNPSDVFGLMWYNINQKQNQTISEVLRHECVKSDDINYYWEAHNSLDYASEIIVDNDLKLELNPQMWKLEYSNASSQEWITVIKGKNKNPSPASLVLYFALEDYDLSDKAFYVVNKVNEYEYDAKGMKHGSEDSRINVKVESRNSVYSDYKKYRKTYNNTWRVKDFVKDDLSDMQREYLMKGENYSYIAFPDAGKTNQPNIIAIQIVLPQGNFEVNVRYSTRSSIIHLDSEAIAKIIATKKEEFIYRFNGVFPVNKGKINNKPIDKIRELTIEAFSNLIGSIGYFYGSIKINLDESKWSEGQYHKGFRYAVEPKGLFTGTPCRSYFARGFLWDEGFHNIIISKWDINLSMDIINSWLNTMSTTGWIPREQIRGLEAISQVPAEFITQDKLIANPPTLIFPIFNFIEYYKYNSEVPGTVNVKGFLKKCFDKLSLQYEWFEMNQKSPDHKHYQWYSRTSSSNFPSGFDDWPRGMTPNIYEDHWDLNIWVIELLKCLRALSEIFDIELIPHFDRLIAGISENIRNNWTDHELNIHSDYWGPQFKKIKNKKFKRAVFPYLWRGDNQCARDVLNPIGTQAECNPYSDIPCCSEFGWCGNTANHCKCPKCKISEKLENRKEFKQKENAFNPHIGYINLFPIMFGFVDPSDTDRLNSIWYYLNDKSELLSDYGVRSWSKSDVLYHTGDDYWRGNIWMNINYLVLRGLYKYYLKVDAVKEIYDNIRNGWINAVYKSWDGKHIFYEQYSDSNGQGWKNRPFNGWTSLIINIIAENY